MVGLILNMLIVSGHHMQLKIKKNVEKVQMRATKLIPEIKYLSYIDVLKILKPSYIVISNIMR